MTILRGFVLTMSLVLAPAVWAQFGAADMTKLASQRMDVIAKTLKLSPSQVNTIKPLLESKFSEMGAAKEKFMKSDKSAASKKEASDSLKAIDSKYDSQVDSSLNPDQVKQLASLKKGWKNDMNMKMPKL